MNPHKTKNITKTFRHRRPNGFSIAEILIALSIAALLITATAVAFDAAFYSYKTNHDMAVTSVSSRNALYQMCSALRSAWNDPAYDIIDVYNNGTECSFVDANGRDIIYKYDANTNQILVNINSSLKWYTMIDNVEPINADTSIFAAIEPYSTDFDAGTVGEIHIRFKVSQNGNANIVSVTTVPRNIVYSRNTNT